MVKKMLVVFSGGMDSTTLVWQVMQDNEVSLVSFDYGQRHLTELASAIGIAHHLGLPHQVIDLKGLRSLLKGSSLTDALIPVPHGHYESESMKATVVPNRNAIMISIAWGIAGAEDMDAVAQAPSTLMTGTLSGKRPSSTRGDMQTWPRMQSWPQRLPMAQLPNQENSISLPLLNPASSSTPR